MFQGFFNLETQKNLYGIYMKELNDNNWVNDIFKDILYDFLWATTPRDNNREFIIHALVNINTKIYLQISITTIENKVKDVSTNFRINDRTNKELDKKASFTRAYFENYFFYWFTANSIKDYSSGY